MKNYFTNNWILFIGLLTLVASSNVATAQEKVTKTVEEVLGNMQGGQLEIEHRRGDVKVVKATGDEASFRLDIVVEGRDKDEMEAFIDVFEVSITGSGNSKRIKTNDQIKSWINSLGRSKVKLQNGDVYTGVKKMTVDMVIAVPDLDKISITNRYEDIYLEAISADVNIDLYSGDLEAVDIDGDVDLKIKYGEATFGTSKNLQMELYESEVRVGSSGEVRIDSKYGDLELGDIGTLSLTSYEDDINAGKVSGRSKLEVKYGNLEFESLQDLEIDFYETDLITGHVQDIRGGCKYGQLRLGKTNSIELFSDYEMEISAHHCDELNLHESKYGDFEIGSIAKKAKVIAYETTVEVQSLNDDFKSLWIESKYDRMKFPLPSNLAYDLDAELKYGDLDYNKSSFKNHDRQEKSSTIKVSAIAEAAKAKVFIRSYETDVALR